MDVRDKLIELLLGKSIDTVEDVEYVVDYLIANGVTVQEWISVEDRLPNCKKVVDGETYFKNVAVRVKGCGFEKIAFYDDEKMCWFDTNFLPAVGEVTHWCELPEWYLPNRRKENDYDGRTQH